MTFHSMIDDLKLNARYISDIADDSRFMSNIRPQVTTLLSFYNEHVNNLLAADMEFGYTENSPMDIVHKLASTDNEVFLTALLSLQNVVPVDAMDEEIVNTLADLGEYSDITMKVFGLMRPPPEMEFEILSDGTIIPLATSSGKVSKSDGTNRNTGWMSWSGVDATVVAVTKNGRTFRALPEIGTISFSIQRDKFDVGGLGSVSRKGHTSGRRTIAGSIIGIILKDEPLKHLQPEDMPAIRNTDSIGADASPYVEYMLPDQLDDFDIILALQNEAGHQARIAIYGITIMSTGQTVSIQDLQTEIVYQYSADDIDLFSYEGGPIRQADFAGGMRTDRHGRPVGSSFNVALETLKTRKSMIESGVSIHASPFKVPNFWLTVNKKSGKVTDVLTEIENNPLTTGPSAPDYSFKKNYYSGSSSLVYFNHIWVPDITSIVYTGTPHDAPVFGYSSENFDALTKGTYIVSGRISMNFVRAGYINEILRLMWYELNVFRETASEDNPFTVMSQIIGRQHMTRIADYVLHSNDSELIREDINKYRHAMRQLIWKPDKKAMDIYPIYRPDQATALRSFKTLHNNEIKEHNVPPLDIYIVFGNPMGNEYEVKKLCDVRFTGYSQSIQDDGSPIQDVFEFIARDMDAPSVDEMTAMGLIEDTTPTDDENADNNSTTRLLAEDDELSDEDRAEQNGG